MAQTMEVKGPSPRTIRRTEARSSRVVIRKVGVWSVLKFSVLFYLCVFVAIMIALVIVYQILGAIGALDSITRLTRDLLADQSFRINGRWLFAKGVAVGLIMVIVWSLVNVFVAFLYNLISDVVGGIDVTLAERR